MVRHIFVSFCAFLWRALFYDVKSLHYRVST